MELTKTMVQKRIAQEVESILDVDTLYGEGITRPSLDELSEVAEIEIDFTGDRQATLNVAEDKRPITRHVGALILTFGIPEGSGVGFLLKSVDTVEKHFLSKVLDERITFRVPQNRGRTKVSGWLFQRIDVPFYFDRFPIRGG